MEKIVSLFALFFILNSCTPDSGTQYSYEIIPIASVDIPTEFTLGQTYPITVHYTAPTSCYYFSSLSYDKDLNVRTIAVENGIAQGNTCHDLSPADGARSRPTASKPVSRRRCRSRADLAGSPRPENVTQTKPARR